MKKEEHIKKYGKEAYKEHLEIGRRRYNKNSEIINAKSTKWRGENPEKVRKNNYEGSRKGGKYYLKSLQYSHTGLRGERTKVRNQHQHQYRQFKKIIASESQIHHQWIPGTANYRGVALVEKDQHFHGFIDVIQILEGEITLLTEAEISIV